jgi:transcriptional regulator with PAS, ATPase and Fis domain
LSLPAQAKLLRALQEGEILPLGAKKPVPVSVRIIAATNRSLEELMNEGKFRSDLYYRVNVYRIHTPTLRERPEDIGDLARYFISNSEFAGASWEISVDAIKYLERYPWPGNIRELRNLIERAVISARARGSKCLDKSDFSVKISSGQNVNKGTGFPTLLPKSPTDVSERNFKSFLIKAEREYVETAIQLFDGNIADTAHHLGIGRSTLFKRLRNLGLGRQKTTDEREESYVQH